MRILCLLRFAIVPEMIGWDLRASGCELQVLEGTPIGRRQMAAAVEEFHPELLFSYAWWEPNLLPEDVAWLRARYHLPHVYWAVDDPTHHQRISLPLAREADLILTTAEELIPAYHALGKKAAVLQLACHPRLHHRVGRSGAERHDIVLVARNYSNYDPGRATYRTCCQEMMVRPLVEAGFDLKVYGGGWDDVQRPFHIPSRFAGPEVPYESLAEIYSAAKIVLGLQTECHSPTQTSCRIFEALGCRAFLLAPATVALGRLFVPGRHLAVSGSPAETVVLARHYLEQEEERERIAGAGQLEVYRKHTYAHRAREFLARVAELL